MLFSLNIRCCNDVKNILHFQKQSANVEHVSSVEILGLQIRNSLTIKYRYNTQGSHAREAKIIDTFNGFNGLF